MTLSPNDLTGRFLLWHNAVLECKHHLQIAFRARKGSDQAFQREEFDTYNKHLKEYCMRQPDYKEGTLLSSHQIEFDKGYARPFPTVTECFSIHDSCIELAILYFCQILNTGEGQQGRAARNDYTFRCKPLPKIVENIFDSEREKEKFAELCEQLLYARNRMIGHADAAAFNIQHGEQVTTMRGPKSAWGKIDLEFWTSFLERMRREILRYSNEGKSKLSK